MDTPLVSVILPTYNRAHCLPRAIESVLAQSYAHLELLVVDDGSTDGTDVLLKTYSDARLRVLSPGRLGSAAKARNYALAHAQGTFIAFQDSDDVWLIEKLEKQIAYAQAQAHPQAAVIACGYLVVMTSGLRAEYRGAGLLERQSDFNSLMTRGHQISTPAWLVRREAFDRVGGFDETMHTWEDWELSMRLDAAGGFVVLDEPLLVSFETPGSVKWNFDAYARTLDGVMLRHLDSVTTNRRILARHRWLQTLWELRMQRPRSARAYLRLALRADPTYWKLWAGMLRRAPALLAMQEPA